MTDFFAFDEHGARELVRMYHRLRGQVQQLQSIINGNMQMRHGDWGRVIRTGKTTTNGTHSVYPAKNGGNTFVVQLQTWTFTEIPGTRAVTRTDWDQYVIARTEDGSWIPEDTYVQVYRHQGKPGRRWWIASPTGKSDVIGKLTNDIMCEKATVAIDPDTTYEIRGGLEVDIDEAYNQFAIKGFANDDVLLKWDAKNERYFIAQLQHSCVGAIADVWDTDPCFNKVGVCFSAPGAENPVVDVTEGCKIWDWAECSSSSGAEVCNTVWPGGGCNQCPSSSSGA